MQLILKLRLPNCNQIYAHWHILLAIIFGGLVWKIHLKLPAVTSNCYSTVVLVTWIVVFRRRVGAVEMENWNPWKCRTGCCGNAELESLEMQAPVLVQQWTVKICVCTCWALWGSLGSIFGRGLLWRMAADFQDSLSLMGMALGCSSPPLAALVSAAKAPGAAAATSPCPHGWFAV